MLAYRLAAPLFAAGLIALAGCAPSGNRFPSLAPRPIEKIATGNPEPQPEPTQPQAPAGPADTELDRAAAEQLAAAEASVAPFAEQFATARAAVTAAKSSAPGSEAWVAAQEAVSRLDQERGRAAIAVATLDQLRIETAKRTTPVDTRRLDYAWERASAIKADQDSSYAGLGKALTPA